MRTLIVPVLFAFAVPCTLPAQVVAGGLELFGSSCAATGGTTCVSHNASGGTLASNNLSNEYAYPFTTSSRIVVSGFELYVAAIGGVKSVPAYLYAATTTGAPSTTPLASTNLTATTTPGFYRASFDRLQILPSGKYFISAWCIEQPFVNPLSPPAMIPSQLTQGTTVTGIYWRRGTPTWAVTGIITRPAFKIICGGGLTPTLRSPGVPEISKVFTFYLQGKSASRVVFAMGVSNTMWGTQNLPLAAPGAPNCWIFSSLDILVTSVTNGSGYATLPLPVPNNKTLIGASFYTQSALNDPQANNLGWLFTNAAKASIGGVR